MERVRGVGPETRQRMAPYVAAIANGMALDLRDVFAVAVLLWAEGVLDDVPPPDVDAGKVLRKAAGLWSELYERAEGGKA